MENSNAKCPKWLVSHFLKRGGTLSFSQFMDLALNDSEKGSYASGEIKIGRDGDFVTSPSLGSDFAELLAIQLIRWFEDIFNNDPSLHKVSLVDIGPGEGDLALDLLEALERMSPNLYEKLDLVLIEINSAMRKRQKHKLSSLTNASVRWTTLEELCDEPIVGVIIAHEILDALPVERLVFRNGSLQQVGIKIVRNNSNYYLKYVDLPLSNEIIKTLESYNNNYNIIIPPINASEGWSTELHVNLDSWFSKVSRAINKGLLLVIDYSLDAKDYYNEFRSSGTIVAYKNQKLYTDVLLKPGTYDITSHICKEAAILSAQKNNFKFIGSTMQGLALLALGLAGKLSILRELGNHDISKALKTRENLLRLVDPGALGRFQWLLFQIKKNEFVEPIEFNTSFLDEPNN